MDKENSKKLGRAQIHSALVWPKSLKLKLTLALILTSASGGAQDSI